MSCREGSSPYSTLPRGGHPSEDKCRKEKGLPKTPYLLQSHNQMALNCQSRDLGGGGLAFEGSTQGLRVGQCLWSLCCFEAPLPKISPTSA